MKRLAFGLLAALMSTTALAQTVQQSSADGNRFGAVVGVPTTGKSYPSDTKSEARGVVLLTPAGVPYSASASGGGGNAAAGTNGATAPTSSSSTGYTNAGGNETPVSPTTPLPTSDANSSSNLTANQQTNTDLGAPGATAAGTDTGTFSINQLIQRSNTDLTTLNTTTNGLFKAGQVIGALPAGTALIGNVGGPETAGAAVTGGGTRIMGSDGTSARDISTDSTGALKPAAATPTTTSVIAVSASTATSVLAANTARIGLQLRTETANSALVYVCYTATTTCSATVHDDVIPISTAAGSLLIPLYAVTSTVYVYSTATVSVSATSWAPK